VEQQADPRTLLKRVRDRNYRFHKLSPELRRVRIAKDVLKQLTQKRLLASNAKLRLSGVNRHIRDIFQYSGFDRILEIDPAAD